MPTETLFHPCLAVHPAVIRELGRTATEVAEGLGASRRHLFAILNGLAAISPKMAIRLEKRVGDMVGAWLRRQIANILKKVQRTAQRLKIRKLEAVE